MTGLYRRSVFVFGLFAVVLGFAVLIRTAYEGGGTVGYAFVPSSSRSAQRGSISCARADGAQAAAPATGTRRTRARVCRVRRDRLVHLLRAWRDRLARARLHAGGARARRPPLPARCALVCGGDGGDSRDRRCRNVCARGLQRPGGLPHGLGALPRLPDRDRAVGALVPHYVGLALGIHAIARRPAM